MAKKKSEADRLFEKALRKKKFEAAKEDLHVGNAPSMPSGSLPKLPEPPAGMSPAQRTRWQRLTIISEQVAAGAKPTEAAAVAELVIRQAASDTGRAAESNIAASSVVSAPAASDVAMAPAPPEAALPQPGSGEALPPPAKPEAAPQPPGKPGSTPGGGQEAPPSVTPGGGLVIGVEMRPPHSLRKADGKACRTDRWFDRVGLVYDSSQPDDGPMGFNNPRLFLAGTSFRCYYPNSTRSDFASIMSSGSSGRWLNAWPEKSNYVQF